ncbi:hypothetical protein AKO1_003691 [Acrasis kona]|uniref:DNA/RNA-binding protein Alba-like domain-containing protein n=1 Tax=Acrasis kona TaxID=1008807 RepID=A0AAW2Z640_9EUKA
MSTPATEQQPNENKIQVSNSKQPLSFYIYLSKKFLTSQDEIELSGLGNAIITVVSCSEILKSGGFVEIRKIQTSTVDTKADGEETSYPKAKIQIWLKKTANFNSLMEQQKKEVEEKKKKQQEGASAKKQGDALQPSTDANKQSQKNEKQSTPSSPAKKQGDALLPNKTKSPATPKAEDTKSPKSPKQ